jgi:transketolase
MVSGERDVLQIESQSERLIWLGKEVRKQTVLMSYRAQTGETGSALCVSDLLVALYFSVLNIFPKEPRHPQRDRFILSKGHGAAALYATLALRGFYPIELLEKYKTNGGVFHGHPCATAACGIEASTGSLGHGLSIGAGMALALQDRPEIGVWVLLGDGECNEGMIWEAAQFIGTKKLSNIKVVIDRNRWQGFGPLSETNGMHLEEQWKAFGFEVEVCSGHDYGQLIPALMRAKCSSIPYAVIADTVAGKGIAQIENTLEAHYFIAKGPLMEEEKL